MQPAHSWPPYCFRIAAPNSFELIVCFQTHPIRYSHIRCSEHPKIACYDDKMDRY